MSERTIDIEVGRYAVRTFRIDRRHRVLLPLTHSRSKRGQHPWRNGTCVAECNHGHRHSPPADDCSCGIYAATNLAALRSQYPVLADNIVAVIAAEGSTIIGSQGLRTQAARVVAYWCHPSPRLNTARAIFSEQCPDAVAYADCDVMLAAYRLRYTADPEQHTPRRHPQLSAASRALSAAHTYGLTSRLMRTARFLTTMMSLIGIPILSACLLTQLAHSTATLNTGIYQRMSAPWEFAQLVTASHGFMSSLIASGLAVHLALDCMILAGLAEALRWYRHKPALSALRVGGRVGLRIIAFLVTHAVLIGEPISIPMAMTAIGATLAYNAYILIALGTIIACRFEEHAHKASSKTSAVTA